MAFLGGTEVLCWENRKPGFPGPARPPAGHLPQLPPILIASASHQLLLLSVLVWSIPLAGTQASSFQAKLSAKACSVETRTLLQRGAYLTELRCHLLPSCEPDRHSQPLDAIIHEPPISGGSPLRDQPQAFSVCVCVLLLGPIAKGASKGSL